MQTTDTEHPDALTERVDALKARLAGPGGALFERKPLPNGSVLVTVSEILDAGDEETRIEPTYGDRVSAVGATTADAVTALETKLEARNG